MHHCPHLLVGSCCATGQYILVIQPPVCARAIAKLHKVGQMVTPTLLPEHVLDPYICYVSSFSQNYLGLPYISPYMSVHQISLGLIESCFTDITSPYPNDFCQPQHRTTSLMLPKYLISATPASASAYFRRVISRATRATLAQYCTGTTNTLGHQESPPIPFRWP
jgi:hypothetical protein